MSSSTSKPLPANVASAAPPKSSFIKRKIDVKFVLAQQGESFAPSSKGDTVTLSGLRVQAMINKAGGAAMGQAQIRIFGMGFSLMNQLSTIGLMVAEVPRNVIEVYAGDDVSGMGLVFVGTPSVAFADFQGAPEACFNVVAHAGYFEGIRPMPVSSYSGSADVATIMQGIASQVGFGFQNSGVSVKLSNPYFPGTPLEQIRAVARAANIDFIVDGNVLAIWPKGQARGSASPLVSPDTGMVGYPTYTGTGICVTSLYTPDIAFGSLIEVKSSLPAANGKWVIATLDYNLESETPNGAWFLTAQCHKPGF